MSDTRPIHSIIVGEGHRCDMGDVDGLASSIAALGLLQPIVISPDGRLLAGARRLRACRQLGWTTIPVSIVEDPDARS